MAQPANLTAIPHAFLQFKVAAKLGDVTLWRRAEQLLVIAAKVRWILIAHTEPGTRGVQVFAEHQAACFLKPYLFLKLQRTHCRDGFEVMMKAGNAHAEFVRELFHSERLVKTFAQMPDGSGNTARVSR